MSLPADIKSRFPLLQREVHGSPIVYLDSAASSQKPDCVLDAMDRYYRTINATVHRGAYEIAAQATDAMERARSLVAAFIGAPSASEVVCTKNATEALNLVDDRRDAQRKQARELLDRLEAAHGPEGESGVTVSCIFSGAMYAKAARFMSSVHSSAL